ncbi:hypothetical protein CPB84DRAFT_1768851 [Gymnopilus junonius]|uniref:Uncharacterized protein n=1 Tax=Gymnopilus junonius TaxID=109634 RepID=A0A9P5TRS0_GYMJU|nr:hypothetical protein CPB84DRAFT_1768851 [Gymnopilus junonius]
MSTRLCFLFLERRWSYLNVTYSQYYAEVGSGIPISENRKDCQLTFGISVPPSFSFCITSTTSHGFYFLDSGVTASQKAFYYFQGSSDQVTAQSNISGPVPGALYSYTAPFSLVFTNMSPCGSRTVLNIDTEVCASDNDNHSGEGFIANDSSDFSQSFHFVWQTCS